MHLHKPQSHRCHYQCLAVYPAQVKDGIIGRRFCICGRTQKLVKGIFGILRWKKADYKTHKKTKLSEIIPTITEVQNVK